MALDGTIYETLQAETMKEGRKYPRDVQKTRFFSVVFCNPDRPHHSDTATGRVMKRLFPSVWEGMLRIWEADGRWKGAVACRMQLIESYLVIERTCGRLAREMPGRPLFTLHDSLVGHRRDMADFGAVLEEEFRAVFGVTPHTKLKPFAPEPNPVRSLVSAP